MSFPDSPNQHLPGSEHGDTHLIPPNTSGTWRDIRAEPNTLAGRPARKPPLLTDILQVDNSDSTQHFKLILSDLVDLVTASSSSTVKTSVELGEDLIISDGYQMIVFGAFTFDGGSLTMDGDLVII